MKRHFFKVSYMTRGLVRAKGRDEMQRKTNLEQWKLTKNVEFNLFVMFLQVI